MTFAGSLARLCWCWPWLLFSVLRWCFEWAERILRFHRYHGYENGKTRRWRQYFRTAAVVLRVDSFSGAHGCVFGMQATYVILLRYTLRIHVLSGVMEVWFPAFGCEKYLFCAKMAIWNRLFCACCTLDATIFNTFPVSPWLLCLRPAQWKGRWRRFESEGAFLAKPSWFRRE